MGRRPPVVFDFIGGAVEEAEPGARPVNFARWSRLEPSQVEASGFPGNSRPANFWGDAGGMLLGAGLSIAALVVIVVAATGAASTFAAAPTTLEITADVLTTDTVRQTIEARGNVRITDGRGVARAAVAVYRVKERRISLSGGVHFVTPDGDLTARQATARVSRSRAIESVEATGDVEVESQRRVLGADYLLVTPASRSLIARGNVRLFAPPDLIATGQQLFARQGSVAVMTGRPRLQNRDGYLQGERLEIDEKAETAYLRTNVLGEFRDIKITSDAATLFAKEKKIVFRDRVKVTQPTRTMTADRVTIFYESRRMIAEGATTIRVEDDRP